MAELRNRSKLTRLTLYVVVFALGPSLALVPLTYATSAHAQNLDTATCTVAKGLVDQGLPIRALALLEDALQPENAVTGALCPDERTAATRKIDGSFLKTVDAQKLLKAEKWPEALATADAALAENLDNEAARTISQAARDEIKQTPKTKLEELRDEWKQVAEHHLVPLVELLVPFAAVLVALLVFSRLLVLWKKNWPSLDETSTAGKRGILIAGILNILISSALFSFGIAGSVNSYPLFSVLLFLVPLISVIYIWRVLDVAPLTVLTVALIAVLLWSIVSGLLFLIYPTEKVFGTLAFAMLAGLFGAALTAWWLATRLRLEIKVTHKDDKETRTEAALVAAFLNELGVEKPRGLEIARGADTTALAGALTALPENAISKAITHLLTTLAGTTPWVANIEGERDRRTVSMTRNGHTVGSAAIDRHTFDASPPSGAAAEDVDPFSDADLRMASAFILATLAKHHSLVEQGLAGATNWRSIGLQYVATNSLGEDTYRAKRAETLARAVELDAKNLPAQLALRHTTDRKSDDARVLIAYRTWLGYRELELKAAGPAASAALLRACYTRTVVATNAVFAPGHLNIEPTSTRVWHARNALEDLDNHVAASKHDPNLAALIVAIEGNSAGLGALLWPQRAAALRGDVASAGKSPIGSYNDACYFASNHSWDLLNADTAEAPPPSITLDDDRVAISLLKRAAANPATASWMLLDPQLKEFRFRGPFRVTFLKDPRSDLFDIEPIRPYAKALKSAGYGNPKVLAQMLPYINPLAHVIPADATVRHAIVELADLFSIVPFDPEEQNWHVELLDQMSTRGLASAEAVSLLLEEQIVGVSHQIAESLVDSFKIGREESTDTRLQAIESVKGQIRTWLAAVRQQNARRSGR